MECAWVKQSASAHYSVLKWSKTYISNLNIKLLSTTFVISSIVKTDSGDCWLHPKIESCFSEHTVSIHYSLILFSQIISSSKLVMHFKRSAQLWFGCRHKAITGQTHFRPTKKLQLWYCFHTKFQVNSKLRTSNMPFRQKRLISLYISCLLIK